MNKDNNLIFEQYISINEGWKDILAASAIGLASLQPTSQVLAAKPEIQQTSNIDLNDMFNYISQSEGKGEPGRPGYMYKDHKGYPTIGIGHLITTNTPAIFKNLFGNINVNDYLSGKIPLSDKMMYKLFSYDVGKKINTAKRLLPKFETYPQYVKNAIIDGLYRGDLGKKTRGYINAGKWNEAAKEYLNHNEYRQEVKKDRNGGIPKRMERNRDQFLKYASGGITTPEPGTKDSNERAIIVKQGDTLSKIASDNKLTIQDILKVNPQIKDPNKIQLGQQIKLP